MSFGGFGGSGRPTLLVLWFFAPACGGWVEGDCARGPDGELYLFPRLVAKGNYSRIGIARVQFDSNGDPSGIQRLGIALEPVMPYELRPDGGGCEDPRVTYVEPLERYVMTYTAFSPFGPRIALAFSYDLLHWERLGLATDGEQLPRSRYAFELMLSTRLQRDPRSGD